MEHLSISRRRFCGSLLALSPVGRLVAASAAEASPAAEGHAAESLSDSWRHVRTPCSLRKICQALSRQFDAVVAPDGALADLRVVWASQQEPPLQSILARLAVLTDSRVIERKSSSGKPRYTLERKPETVRREAAWKSDRLRFTIRELIRAADQKERGGLDPSTFSKNVQTYLDIGRAPQLAYLRLLTPEQTDQLLDGAVVRLPMEKIPQTQIEQIVNERYSPEGREDENPQQTQKYREDELRRIRQYGLGLQIDFNRKGHLFYLMLQIGNRGGNVLCAFGEEELGLPLARTNPYRLLETGPEAAPPPTPAPDALRRKLETDVAIPAADGSWEAVLRALAKAAELDVVSDGYLCRARSRQYARGQERLVVVQHGIMLSEALDLVCRQYGYLWWEEDGVFYFRSRDWPWDQPYETPDSFLDPWTAALRRGMVGAPEIAALVALTPLQLNGMDNLRPSQYLRWTHLDNEDVQQFLRLFRSSTPAQQAQLIGPGLIVPPEQVPGSNPPGGQEGNDSPPHPVQLRLSRQIQVDSSVSPPVTAVPMQVTRPLESRIRPMDFSVEIPAGVGELDRS